MSVTIGGRAVSGDLVGGSVVINGVKITSGGRGTIVIGTEDDAPEVHESYDGIRSVSIESDGGDVFVSTGDKFTANGHGSCRKSGNMVRVSQFSGELILPDLDKFDVEINSGSIRGGVGSASLDVKVNSGNLALSIRNKDHAPVINAKVNSGNVNITVM